MIHGYIGVFTASSMTCNDTRLRDVSMKYGWQNDKWIRWYIYGIKYLGMTSNDMWLHDVSILQNSLA